MKHFIGTLRVEVSRVQRDAVITHRERNKSCCSAVFSPDLKLNHFRLSTLLVDTYFDSKDLLLDAFDK